MVETLMTRFRFSIAVPVMFVAMAVLNFVPLPGGPDGSPAPTAVAPAQAPPDVSAGPGLVEAVSEEIRVSGQVGGRLDRVLVDEGDRVTAGDVLAVIDNRDFQARVASAEAELRLREAEHRRLVNGARLEERQEAAAAVAEANAVLQHAITEHSRQQTLLAAGVSARADADAADRTVRVASARIDAARERFALVNADAREEDRARAEAEISMARARLMKRRSSARRSPVSSCVGCVSPARAFRRYSTRRLSRSQTTGFAASALMWMKRTSQASRSANRRM